MAWFNQNRHRTEPWIVAGQKSSWLSDFGEYRRPETSIVLQSAPIVNVANVSVKL